jgi:light-regulated signal transduction histidine kinase (bacteriophytochrome)
VQSANRSFYQTFQVTPQETENRLVYELGDHQWDIPRLRRLLEEVLPEKKQFIDFEVEHCFERIGHRTVVLNARAILREAGRPGLILLAIEDITDRKRAEQQLARVAAELQQSNQKLTRSNRELQDFAYVVSHDLRAPLVNIQGFSKELALSCERLRSVAADAQVPEAERGELSALLDEDIPEAIEFITTSATKMDSLLSGVLELSRVGRAALTVRQLDMSQMLSEIVASMQFAIDQAGASVQVHSLPPCQGDQMQINQVFSNLLDNALKYLDPNRPGVIRVCGQEEPDRVVYSIEDNGIGIGAAHQDSIYKIFQRLDPRRGTGIGLGLTIVRRVLERQRGKVWVESEVNEGSKFYVSLPKG